MGRTTEAKRKQYVARQWRWKHTDYEWDGVGSIHKVACGQAGWTRLACSRKTTLRDSYYRPTTQPF